jgi:hypothetical protein
MKSVWIILCTASMIGFTACAQQGKNVPPEVKTAFSQKFPDATQVKWDRENATEWEAEFVWNGTETSANFDNSGAWMETEYKISTADIPATVQTTLDKQFTDWSIDVAEVSETIEGSVFEFELQKGRKKSSVSIDMSGTVLEKEQMTREEEADEDDFR